MILYPHLDTNEAGHLTIGSVDTVSLAKEFGTPAYVYDESVIRNNIRTYLSAASKHFGADALPLFASKAFSCKEIYRIAAEEGIGIDCVSGGELYTAKACGFPAERIYFHGNNKTDADICQALDMGVGIAIRNTGTASRPVPFWSPPIMVIPATATIGPSAPPMFPPTENRLMPFPFFSPAT